MKALSAICLLVVALASTIILISCGGDDEEPVNQECESTPECPEGMTCLLPEGECHPGCEHDEDCPNGDCFFTGGEFTFTEGSGWDGPGVCESGCLEGKTECIAGTHCDPGANLCINDCTNDDDCDGEYVCGESGLCVRCEEDDDCPAGSSCEGNICKSDSEPDTSCEHTCRCTCPCGTSTVTSSSCLDCDRECPSACQDMCGGY